MEFKQQLFTLLFLAFAAIPQIYAQCDGGSVMTSDSLSQVYTCPGDTMDDIIEFSHTTTAGSNYAYVITDPNGNILGLPPGNSQNFEGAGSGTCLVWGLSYTGTITAQAGDNALQVALSDGCFDLSDNFITVIRDSVDGGTVAMPSGATERNTCASDGEADVVMFTHETASNARYAYVVTDPNGNILGFPPGNSLDFDGAGAGTCLVWGLSYTGNITAQVGDNAMQIALTDDCFDLSDNFITINRAEVDGGTVSTDGGETMVFTCASDGMADVLTFAHETSSEANYAYVITDPDGNILGIPPGNSQDFEGAGTGTCLVWGLSYTGSITAQAGDNAMEIALTDGCFDLSEDYITVERRENCAAGFTLVNADTDEDLAALNDGDIVDISAYGMTNPRRLNVRVDITGDTPASVVFSLDAEEVYNIEQIAPYALGGDNNGDYHPTGMAMSFGDHSLKATPYWSYQGMGAVGTPMSANFTIIASGNSNRQVSGFNVYPNPTSNSVRLEMPEGERGQVLVRVMNTLGDAVQAEQFETATGNWHHELNVSHLPAGTYIIHILNGEIQQSTRLVKN